MASWGNTDDAANSVSWAVSQFNKTANSENQTDLYGNTTPGAFVPGLTVGQFGVDTTEMSVANGSIVTFTVTFPGSGYAANAAVTVGGNATSNAQSNSTGRIATVHVNTAGDGYTTAPTVTVAAPAAQTINANTALFIAGTFNAQSAVDGTDDFITITSNQFVDDDVLLYSVSAGNTAVGGLTTATNYYVVDANSSGVSLSLTQGGDKIELTPGSSETGHTLTRRTGGFIEIGTNVLQVGDIVTYAVATGNTALTGLVSGTPYHVVHANTTGIKISGTPNGDPISPTPGVSETGHSFTGQTATAAAVISGASSKGFHAGWVIRKVGTGGRAGRVQYETLVAMGSIASDGSDDTIFKDA